MYIMDSFKRTKNLVMEFCDAIITDDLVAQWSKLRGIPEDIRAQFLQDELGRYLLPQAYGGGAYSVVDRCACVSLLAYRSGATLPYFMDMTTYGLLSGLRNQLDDNTHNEKLLHLEGVVPPFAEAFVEPGYADRFETLSTSVERRGNDLMLDGCKTLVSNGEFVSSVLVLASDPVLGSGDSDMSLWLVPTRAAGVSVKSINTTGLSILAPSQMSFDDVVLEPSWRVETEGKLGFVLKRQYELRCVFMCAIAVGLVRAALEDVRAYMDEYAVSDLALAGTHRAKADVFDKEVLIQAMEFFVREAADAIDDVDDRRMFKACKSMMSFVPKTAASIADDCLKMFGLRGYLEDVRIRRVAEDCRGIALRQSGERIMLNQLFRMF